MGQMMTIALVFVLLLNFSLFVVNEAVAEIGEDDQQVFYCNESIFGTISDECQEATTSGFTGALPTTPGTVNPDTGTTYTDTWATMKRWVQDVPGLNIVFGIITAFHSFLTRMGLPISFVVAVDMLWYGICIILIISFIRGTD